jgi:hypothetical protein
VDAVSGCVNLVVQAYDRPPLPLRGAWSGAVLPPYRVSWAGLFSGSWFPLAVHPSLELDHLFDGPVNGVYAPGTRQNLPNAPGKYYFWLARNLDTTTLDDGPYTISVSVSDIRGNEASASFSFTVANGAAAPPP